MRIAVVGSRSFTNQEYGFGVLDGLRALWETDDGHYTTIVSGAAAGADTVAKLYASNRALNYVGYPADWNDLSHPDAVILTGRSGKQYDAKAGFRRNQTIVDNCDVVVAFWDGTSRGTKDTLQRAKVAGKPVYVFWQGISSKPRR